MREDLNLRPLARQASALPLSYAPTNHQLNFKIPSISTKEATEEITSNRHPTEDPSKEVFCLISALSRFVKMDLPN